ncbi:MAG: hypothetical protein R2695_04485 [Acidimicrobiales bacterium]
MGASSAGWFSDRGRSRCFWACSPGWPGSPYRSSSPARSGARAPHRPLALREPWRFYVRDALSARTRFAEAIADAEDGPLRERLREIEQRLSRAVDITWDVARRGQQLTDARRGVDLAAVDAILASTPVTDPRHGSALAQRQSHDRMEAREADARRRLDVLAAQVDSGITRAAELATRSGGTTEVDELAGQVGSMVDELDSLRIALDEVGDEG